MYDRSSASFPRTWWYSPQFTFLLTAPCTSATSSFLANRFRNFRLLSWKASFSRCSNSWKASPIARRSSDSEMQERRDSSSFETTCIWRPEAFVSSTIAWEASAWEASGPMGNSLAAVTVCIVAAKRGALLVESDESEREDSKVLASTFDPDSPGGEDSWVH